MNFGQALEILNQGGKIKVPEWKGYWFKESGMVKVMTAEGQVLETPHFQQYIFREDWEEVGQSSVKIKQKTLGNTTANGAKKNVKDIQFWGDGDTFKLISKASSEAEGWMKSTKAMFVGTGCVVQVTTQQRNPDGSYAVAEAVTFVPGVAIKQNMNHDQCVSRELVKI